MARFPSLFAFAAMFVACLGLTAGRASAQSAISGGSCDRGLFTNQNIGTVLGAAVGGLLGSQFGGGSGKAVATIAGVIGGGFLGNQIGQGMDQADQRCMAQTLDYARPGQTVTWRNPDNGRDYRVTPRDEMRRHGRRCRTVDSQAMIDGQPATVTSVACRQRDGSWKFES